jgi:hypothetical protein
MVEGGPFEAPAARGPERGGPDLGTEDPESPLRLRDHAESHDSPASQATKSGRPAAGRYGVTVTTENMPALKWPGMLQTKR